MIIAPLIILITMNWLVAVLLVGFLLVYAVSYFVFRKTLYNVGLEYREEQGKFFSSIFEQLRYIRLTKTNSIQPEMTERLDKGFAGFKNIVIRNQKVNYVYSSLDGFISTLAQIILFVVGGMQVLSGNFTIGMFTIFTSYFGMILGSSRYFFGLGASYQNVMVAYNRIKEILDIRKEGCGVQVIDDINEIEFNNVSFSYRTHAVGDITEKEVLKGLGFKLSKGKVYAFVGSNGSGKSTLASLLMGMYIGEYGGRITYDGTDIKNIDMVSTRRKLIGFAEQEPTLIKDSILFNLYFGNMPMNHKSQLDKFLQILGMDGFIAKNGLDFSFNEDNNNTSGGEKQKISILKVILKDPAVMIFDEPTSALDFETSVKFIEYLKSVKEDKIIIIVTHDESIKNSCDEVIELSVTQKS